MDEERYQGTEIWARKTPVCEGAQANAMSNCRRDAVLGDSLDKRKYARLLRNKACTPFGVGF
jgi:hypothetical protein